MILMVILIEQEQLIKTANAQQSAIRQTTVNAKTCRALISRALMPTKINDIVIPLFG